MYTANAKMLRLVPNAIYIPLTCVGVSRWGNANFRFGVGVFAFLDTNMLVYLTQNSRVGGVTQRQTPTRRVSHHSGI